LKHINVALFVPDEGCPHRCSFCNQKTISGKTKRLEISDIDSAVKTALESADCNKGEIAFFGGSFTAIDKDYMISLLERAKQYIDKGLFAGIRVSTRPDCINEEVLDILKYYGVTSIELGCQSMNDEVLRLNNRGHSAEDVVKSAGLIKAYGFEFGVQMMTGLYGDDDKTAIETARRLIALAPDTARIYPTVVLENTELERLYRLGQYKPQTVDEAAEICSELLLMFQEADIRVIRVGLHSGGNVEEGFVAGAYHPAFREICESRIYLRKVLAEINRQGTPEGDITVTVGTSFVSMMSGQKKANSEKLRELGYNLKIKQDKNMKKYEIEVGGKI
jgi:histone acetyltransferase (RNA polymerase elongator complex component)